MIQFIQAPRSISLLSTRKPLIVAFWLLSVFLLILSAEMLVSRHINGSFVVAAFAGTMLGAGLRSLINERIIHDRKHNNTLLYACD